MLAVMAIICWAWPRLSAFFSAIQQRALHAGNDFQTRVPKLSSLVYGKLFTFGSLIVRQQAFKSVIMNVRCRVQYIWLWGHPRYIFEVKGRCFCLIFIDMWAAAGPLDPDLEERRRAARLHQQQAAERAQAEVWQYNMHCLYVRRRGCCNTLLHGWRFPRKSKRCS